VNAADIAAPMMTVFVVVFEVEAFMTVRVILNEPAEL
jgi:hypothetical protein